ncbi:MAG: hypothetical protein ACJ75B_21355 [Flavisolibacter sp.]
MGLLNQQRKKGDKKSSKKQSKIPGSQSKFIMQGSRPSNNGFTKKIMTGGAQRGS